MTTRREFLAKSAVFSSVAVLGVSTTTAHAQINLGETQIDVVSDGSLTLPGSFIYDPMPKDELLPILERYGQSPDILTPPCNVTMLRRGDRTVLFDVGSGPDFSPNSGALLESLNQLGIAPEDVTDIVFTHAHPDHLWGILDDFGDPLFPDASYMIGRIEWDYWTNPNTVNEIEEARASFAVGAKRRLDMIEDRIEFFDDGDEIMSGVAARATLGHTPGHMSFEVRHGSDAVMILGDCIGNEHIAFARPEWVSGADQDQETGAATRVALFDQLSHEKTRVVGFHLAGDGVGYVDKTADEYVFVADNK